MAFTENIDAFFADFGKDIVLNLDSGDVTIQGIFSGAESGFYQLDDLNTDRIQFVVVKTEDSAAIVQGVTVDIAGQTYNVLFPLLVDGEGFTKMELEKTNAG